jgi:cytochrome c6
MAFIKSMLTFKHIKPLLVVLVFSFCFTKVSYAADPGKGHELYTLHCANCHGAAGLSDMQGVPNFSQNESLMSPDGALLISIQNGKNIMPAYRGILSDQDILDVISYLRTLN